MIEDDAGKADFDLDDKKYIESDTGHLGIKKAKTQTQRLTTL